MQASSTSAALSIAATYKHLAVVVTTCSTCGSLRVSLGATTLATVNLHSASTVHDKVIEVAAPPSAVTGTIKLAPAASGAPVIVEGLAASEN